MSEENGWLRKIAENPGHSRWYIQRFRDMAARGEDQAGEARLPELLMSAWDVRPFTPRSDFLVAPLRSN